MGKIEDNKQVKEESLLDTAFRLFTTKGIGKTSISDIVENAGVAKGTFYLYFKDKYDIRNRLVSHKSSQLFQKAAQALEQSDVKTMEDKIIFMVDNLINQLNENRSLLHFISKNLSWGIFKNAMTTRTCQGDVNFRDIYEQMLRDTDVQLKDPEIMLFMIVELVSSTCYSAILYEEPVGLKELKPYLYDTIRTIIHGHEL